MKRLCFCTIVALFSVVGLVADEKVITPTLDKVALFKNGYIIVHQSIDIPAPGFYRWDSVPAAVHGTFFVESDLEIEIRTTRRETLVTEEKVLPPHSLESLIGKRIGVRTNTAPLGHVGGTLIGFTSQERTRNNLGNVRPAFPTDWSLILQEECGYRFFIPMATISMIETEPTDSDKQDHVPYERTEIKPVMTFHVKEQSGKSAGKIHMMYLTQGATWAPSYRIKLLNDTTLSLEQTTVLRNEWLPIHDAEISLVSGFPQIETAGVLSPFLPSLTLEQFLLQLSMPPGQVRSTGTDFRSQMITNTGMLSNVAVPSVDVAFAAFPAQGEGPDIHYNNIGRRTLAVGDSLILTTGKAETAYERVLSCDLTDSVLAHWRQNAARAANMQIEVFDVVKFANPLPFPMTTAPVTITDVQRFLGQSKTFWVNPQQLTTVNITKVMNVSVAYSDELELDTQPVSTMRYGGRNYQQVSVTGTVEIVNRRGEPVTLHLTNVVLGAFDRTQKLGVECSIAPTMQTLLPIQWEYAPNSTVRLHWEIPLQPGEKKDLTIQSSRWIPN